MKYSTIQMISVVVFCFCLSANLTSQTTSNKITPTISYAKAQDAGMSAERLARIDAICLDAINDNHLPGIVVLVARHGKIVYKKAFGTSNAKTKKALKTDDIFRLASQSKAITATAVMMLWEQGKFRLDDPVSKYIPEFKNPVVLDSLHDDSTYTTTPADKEITIRHLLTHTSGIGYGVIDGDPRIKRIYEDAGIVDLFTTKDISIADNTKKLAKLPLHHNPGEKFTYSESYDVLGYLIEVISGMPFDAYLRKHIFDPLGMDDTWFYLPEDKANRLVAVQSKEDGNWKNYPVTFYDTDYPIKGAKRFFSGGAGLSSTAEDYSKFLQMYLNKGVYDGQRLLSRTTVNIILANQIGDLWGEDPTVVYGLAFAVQEQKGENKGESGSKGSFSWGGYFNTQYFADPKEQTIGIILKQTQGPVDDKTGWQFPLLVAQAIDD
jgi:CubicO group peptidase (beta-lactamase class C family)